MSDYAVTIICGALVVLAIIDLITYAIKKAFDEESDEK